MYDQIAALIDGGVATGDYAFDPSQGLGFELQGGPGSPERAIPGWDATPPRSNTPEYDGEAPIDPILLGEGGRVVPPPTQSQDSIEVESDPEEVSFCISHTTMAVLTTSL